MRFVVKEGFSFGQLPKTGRPEVALGTTVFQVHSTEGRGVFYFAYLTHAAAEAIAAKFEEEFPFLTIPEVERFFAGNFKLTHIIVSGLTAEEIKGIPL